MRISYAASSIDLRGTYEERLAHHDPIEVTVHSFFSEALECHLISFDMMHMCFERCNALRASLAAALHLDPRHIIVHCTHTHTGPRDEDLDHALLLPRLTACLQDHQQRAEPVSVAFTEIDSQGRWNVNRRLSMPHGMGKFCLWAGAEETDDGHFDGGRVIRRRLKDWFGEDFDGTDFNAGFYYDQDQRDTALQWVLFKNDADEVVGSIVRFACHPAVAGHTTDRRYSADFPGLTRRLLQERLGGSHMWLTGPCGNITARESGSWQELSPGHVASMLPLGPHQDPDGSFKEVQRLAGEIVSALMETYPEQEAFSPLDALDMQFCAFDMQLRDDLNPDPDAAIAESKAIWDQLEQTEPTPEQFASHKYLADQYMFLSYHKQFIEQGYITAEQIRQGHIPVNVVGLRLNNIILQGCPGESFWEIPGAAAQCAAAHDMHFMSFSFANGEVTYLPTTAERPFGDYETCYCIAHADAVDDLEQQLHASTQSLIDRSMQDAAP